MGSNRKSRRGFLQHGAALAGLSLGGVPSVMAQTPASDPTEKGLKELIAYGERSKYVTSIRVPVAGRMSPDMYGLTFHVLTPLQDQFGIITPSSLFYVATHRGSYVPEINPTEHRLMIHRMVERPLIFTMNELERLPFVPRVHFMECAGHGAHAP